MKYYKWIFSVISAVLAFVMYFADYEPKYEIKFMDNIYIHPHDTYYFITEHEASVKINSDTMVIPAGFDTDLSTVPRILLPISLLHYPSFLLPALMHDYLYTCPGHVSRRVIDDILYSALTGEGMNKGSATVIWVVVRLFSSNFFNKGFDCHE